MEGALSVDLRVIREDEKVIHIDDEPSFGNHVSEGVIHKSLESGRGIAKSKEHGSKSPLCVMKAAFHWSLSLILTLLYPDLTSILVKTDAPLSLSTRSKIRGRG